MAKKSATMYASSANEPFEIGYPQSLPVDAFRYLVTQITTGTIGSNREMAAKAAFNIQGYAMKELIGDKQLMGESAVQMSQNEFIECCKVASGDYEHVKGQPLMTAEKIDWRALIRYLVLNVLPLVL